MAFDTQCNDIIILMPKSCVYQRRYTPIRRSSMFHLLHCGNYYLQKQNKILAIEKLSSNYFNSSAICLATSKKFFPKYSKSADQRQCIPNAQYPKNIESELHFISTKY